MSVMLANRYVQAHRFGDALPHFEAQLRKNPADRATALKLVLCYAQAGRVQEAIDLMTTLLEEAPERVFAGNHDEEGIPARHVTAILERRRKLQSPDLHHATLALICLYTDWRRALAELDAARRSNPQVTGLERLDELVRSHLEEPT